MKNTFRDKVVIITGASSGIGLAIAREFADNGSKVVLAARSGDKLSLIVKELNGNKCEAVYFVTDVSKESDCRQLVEKTIELFGAIDILINNAGISMIAPFSKVDLKVLHRLMNVNFWGTVYCTKYALPYLIKRKGSLVGISSVAGIHGLPGRTGYSASKFAMNGFLETVRIENLNTGLHVMIIAPGFTDTGIRQHALNAFGLEHVEYKSDESKLMHPDEVAKWVLKGIRWRMRTKILSRDGRLTSFLQIIAPKYVDRVFYRKMSKESDL